MQSKIAPLLLAIMLTACAPATMSVPTGISVPTAVLLTATPTVTATVFSFTSTPGTQPFTPIITPDAIQVARWQEYQTELAKIVLSESGTSPYPDYKYAICEWDILGESGQEIYVWAVCSGPSASGNRPAVIYLEANGAVQKVEVVQGHSSPSGFSSNEGELFPSEVIKIAHSYYIETYPFLSDRALELIKHLNYRQMYPNEPPLVILSAMPAATQAP